MALLALMAVVVSSAASAIRAPLSLNPFRCIASGCARGSNRRLALGGATPGLERAAVVGAAGLVVRDRRRRARVAVRSARAAGRDREARGGARDRDRPDV